MNEYEKILRDVFNQIKESRGGNCPKFSSIRMIRNCDGCRFQRECAQYWEAKERRR